MNAKKKKSAGRLIGDTVFWTVIALVVFSRIWFKWTYVESGSMKPLLSVGAIVMVDPHQEAEVGDVAMYRVGDGYVIHRIIDEENGEYIFKGDNVGNPDAAPVPKSEVVGPMTGHINLFAPLVRAVHHLNDV